MSVKGLNMIRARALKKYPGGILSGNPLIPNVLSPYSKMIELVAEEAETRTMKGSGSTFYEYVPIPDGPGKEQLSDIVRLLPPLNLIKGPWIGGGAPRRLLQGRPLDGGDVDIFFNGSLGWKGFEDVLSGFEIVHQSSRASTYLVNGLKVQIIKRCFYETVDAMFQDFDFSVCQIATDGRTLAVTPQAHKDIVNEVLRFAPQGRISKQTVVGRMIKYVNHGFLPEPKMFSEIIKSGLDMNSQYIIFDKNGTESNYDIDTTVEDIIETKNLTSGVLRTLARDLGLTHE